MSDFIVSARKYRPVRFGDVVGQEHITTTLRNAIRSEQLAHSFLFCGPRGVGKTTCARILAQSINCQTPVDGVEPCGTCGPCKSFRESSSFNIYEIDAASNNSVEDIRALTEQVRFPPQAGRYKVYIIDEVHMLSQAAFNAFLKTLEEPPSYAIFILATTEKHKIIPTILSRCQIFDFNRIQVADIAGHLQGICETEKIPFEPQGLHVIAQKADGGMRDALSMFDRILAFSGGSVRLPEVLENLNILDYDVFFGLVEAFAAEDLATVLQTFQRVLERGFEGDVFLSGLAEHLRNLLVAKDPATHNLLELSEGLRERYISQASWASGSFLVSALSLLNQADIHFKASRHKRLHVETALVKLTYLHRAVDLSAESAPVPVKKKQPDEPSSALKPPQGSGEGGSAGPATFSAGTPAPAASSPAAAAQPAPAKPAPAAPSPVAKPSASGVKLPNLRDLAASLERKPEPATAAGSPSPGTIAPFAPEAPGVIDLPALRQAWTEHAAGHAQNNRMSLAKLMEAARLDKKDDASLLVLVDNNIQQELLREEMPAYREKLFAAGLHVQAISIEIVPDLQAAAQAVPYSSQDRLARMVEKNPLLNDLREKLGLELDF
ncbi:MAG: DNA polymerase III subunit gamma/tau [Bacteroidetes bacterium]|nr:DNA polymerase III subunit gamma/tau [Bacteroidota bacterium]